MRGILRRRELKSKIEEPDYNANDVHRTLVPRHWFSDVAEWSLLLARRWKWRLAIHLAEARAGVLWLAILVTAVLNLWVSKPLRPRPMRQLWGGVRVREGSGA